MLKFQHHFCGFSSALNFHCQVTRNKPLRRDVGGRGSPRGFVEQRQASLDRRYGEGKYQVFLQRERPPPAPGFSLWPKGDFDPAQVSPAQKVGRAERQGKRWKHIS